MSEVARTVVPCADTQVHESHAWTPAPQIINGEKSCPGVVPATELQTAAALMREEHRSGHKRHKMWWAMASLIETAAYCECADTRYAAFVVARRYMEAPR